MNIVLVHGILGFREELGIEYFNGVAERLEDLGHKVLAPQLNATGTILERGEQLRGLIWVAFGDGGLDPDARTHIIGHSQGGLDSRFVLSPGNPNTNAGNDLSSRITSLSTIGSPHQGSRVADLLAGDDLDGVLGSLTRDGVADLLKALRIDPDALLDLGTASMEQFNKDYPDNPAVHYFSVAGQGRAGPTPASRLLLGLHDYVKRVTGEENDGLVTVSSAERWGASWPAWPADHVDEIGHDLDRPPEFGPPPGFKYLAKYDAIVNRVSAL